MQCVTWAKVKCLYVLVCIIKRFIPWLDLCNFVFFVVSFLEDCSPNLTGIILTVLTVDPTKGEEKEARGRNYGDLFAVFGLSL